MTDVRYKIDIDGKQADAELARLHAGATSLAGSEDRLATSAAAATRAIQAQGAATSDTAKKTLTFREQVNKLPDVLGKQAAAISLVSSSMAGQSGEVGKLVAGAGQMAAAYGAGGPFALALVGGMALVSSFSSHLEKLNRQQDEALNRVYAGVDRASKEAREAAVEVSRLQDLVDPTGASQGKIADVQERAIAKRREAREKAEQANATGLDREISRLQRLARESEAAGLASAERYADEADALKTRQTNLIAEANLAERTADSLQKQVGLLEEAAKKGGAKTDGGAKIKQEISLEEKAQDYLDKMREEAVAHRIENERNANAELLRIKSDAVQAEIDLEEKAMNWVAKMGEESVKHRLDNERKVADAKQRISDEAERASEEALAIERATYESHATAITGMAAGIAGQLFADIVGQQDKALERAGISALQAAGTFVVGEGMKAVAAGAARLVISAGLDPTAYATVAGGLAITGIGAGLGGLGAGLAQQLAGSGSSTGPSERGVPSGFSGGATGGGGGTSITIVYGGASGPTADHAVTAISDTLTRASARNALRDEVR